LFGVEGMHVLDVTRNPDVGGGQGLVVLDVESDADLTGCTDRGVVAVGHGRHVQVLHDAPCFAVPSTRPQWAWASSPSTVVTENDATVKRTMRRCRSCQPSNPQPSDP
jgi:hypothetical protein